MKLYGKSWLTLKQNLQYLPIPMLADLLTVVAIMGAGILYKFITIKRFSALFMSAVQAQPAGTDLNFVIFATVLLFALIYIIFTLLQSVSWYWVYKFCSVRRRFTDILKHYALYNILWTLLIMLVTVVHRMLLVSMTFAGAAESRLVNVIVAVIYIIIGYFAIVSYLMKPLKTGFKKGNIIIPVLFLIWLTYQVLDYFAYLAGQAGQAMGIIVSILVLLPVFIWARVYLILATKEVLK